MVVLASPHTDIFLLMGQMYPRLSGAISIRTDNGNTKRKVVGYVIYDNLGQRQASAILSFQALTGSDKSGQWIVEARSGTSRLTWLVMRAYSTRSGCHEVLLYIST